MNITTNTPDSLAGTMNIRFVIFMKHGHSHYYASQYWQCTRWRKLQCPGRTFSLRWHQSTGNSMAGCMIEEQVVALVGLVQTIISKNIAKYFFVMNLLLLQPSPCWLRLVGSLCFPSVPCVLRYSIRTVIIALIGNQTAKQMTSNFQLFGQYFSLVLVESSLCGCWIPADLVLIHYMNQQYNICE